MTDEHIPLNRPRLIAPGPVEVSPQTLLALSQPQMHHRSPEARAKLIETRGKLTQLLGDPYEAVIVTGSGTAAFEGALVSTVPAGAKVVNASAGKFSERWGEMARRLGYDVTEVQRPWGELLARMKSPRPARARMPCSSPIPKPAPGRCTTLQADCGGGQRPSTPSLLIILPTAVTSYGVAELRPAAWNVDVIVSGSQKATATPPGLGFVLFSPEAESRLIKNTPKGFYLDLQRELSGQKEGNTPQTPAINLIYALDAALDRLLSVPREVLWAEKKRQNDALIAAGTALGCRSWASRPSPAVAVLVPPEGLGGKQVAAQLASMNQRALPGQAPHEDTVFRISTLGYADRYDALSVAGILEDAFSALGVKFERGAAVAAAWQVISG